jgi:hypothetical protein
MLYQQTWSKFLLCEGIGAAPLNEFPSYATMLRNLKEASPDTAAVLLARMECNMRQNQISEHPRLHILLKTAMFSLRKQFQDNRLYGIIACRSKDSILFPSYLVDEIYNQIIQLWPVNCAQENYTEDLWNCIGFEEGPLDHRRILSIIPISPITDSIKTYCALTPATIKARDCIYVHKFINMD